MAQAASDALRRLLAEAGGGGQAKVDALVALSQRTVFVPTWRIGDDGYRTVVSSNGVAALPVWLDFEALADAAAAFGWAMPDGRVAYKEIGARAALGHGLANNLLVVVEMGAEHSMEVEQEEMRLLLAPQARSESSGAFAGAGRLQSSLMRAVRPPSGTPPAGFAGMGAAPTPAADRVTAPPGYVAPKGELRAPSGAFSADTGVRNSLPQQEASSVRMSMPEQEAGSVRTSMPQRGDSSQRVSLPLRADGSPRPVTQTFGAPTASPGAQATFGGSAGGVTIAPLQSDASDALLRTLANALRTFPEVEWALLASVARGPAPPVPTVAVRVDASFRMRVNDIVAAVRAAAAGAGAGLDVLLLDDAQLMRLARAAGQPFYPWRR
jgi:hypothetical protein